MNTPIPYNNLVKGKYYRVEPSTEKQTTGNESDREFTAKKIEGELTFKNNKKCIIGGITVKHPDYKTFYEIHSGGKRRSRRHRKNRSYRRSYRRSRKN